MGLPAAERRRGKPSRSRGDRDRVDLHNEVITYLSHNPATDPGDPPSKPAELALLEELEVWSVLPHMGGYLDQPITLMADLRTVRIARSHHENAKQASSGLQAQVDQLMARIPGLTGGGM